MSDEAIAFVRNLHPKGKNFRIERVREFLDGETIYVGYTDEDGEDITDVVYREGNSFEYLMIPEDVVDKVQEKHRSSAMHRFLNSIINTGGITGLLALIMTIAVVYLAIWGNTIPTILEQALLLAFGFYFGKMKTT